MDYESLAREFVRNMRSVHRAGPPKGVQEGTQGEAFVLHCIKESRDDIIPSHISDAAGISSARVAAALNSLESKGFITRAIDSSDRRKIIIRMTSKGAEYAEEQERKHLEMLTRFLALLGEHDAKELVRIIGRVAEVVPDLTAVWK
ncbi:MAG: MarR family transcriptional regulator [Methanomassiliicoccaceae archaeon]|nr:MarR family transcriptional regulator [Methanomassiliicoccaceae archaeon]